MLRLFTWIFIHTGRYDDGEYDLAKLMKGRDAVYFTAGSRGKDLLQTDAYGAVKTMQAAKKLGIERYILVQSLLWNLTSGISMAWIKY